MAIPRLGFGSFLALAEESTWGTANTTWTNWIEVISVNPTRVIERVPVPTLGKAPGSFVADRMVDVTDYARITTETVLSYNDATQLLLAHCMHRDPVTTGAGPYTHTYEIDIPYDDGDTGAVVGMTIGVQRGKNAKSEAFEGAMVASFSIRIAAGQPTAVLRIDWIAETSAARGSALTPTFSSGGAPVLSHQGGSLSFNSVSYCVREVELSVNYNLAERLCISSKNSQIPAPTAATEIRLRVALDDPDDAGKQDTLYAAYLAQTAGDVTWTMTSGASSFAFTVQNAQLVSFADQPVQGVTQINAEWMGLGSYADSEPGLKIVVVNANSAHTAN